MNLQAVGGPAVEDILLDVLKSESAASEVRAAAAQVLNQLGGNAAEENAALIDKLITPPDTGSE